MDKQPLITNEIKMLILKNMINTYKRTGGSRATPKQQIDFMDKLLEIIEMESE